MGGLPAQVGPVVLFWVRLIMDLFFCDICNESVPQSDLDKGMAFRRGERVVCATCDLAMSNEGVPADGAAADVDPGGEKPATSGVEAEGGEVQAGVEPAPSGSAEPSSVGGSGGSSKLSGCLFTLLLLLLVLSIGVNAFLWNEGVKVHTGLQADVSELHRGDDALAERFSDMQTNVSRQGQERDTFVRGSIESMSGVIEEKFANQGNRIGRLDNSIEGLRQSTAEDRRALEKGAKDAATSAGIAKTGVDTMKEDLGYLSDRIAALEEVLEGGMVDDGGDPDRRQPSWFSHLPGLKDASAGNRWNAVTVLGDTGDPRVVQHLIPMLADDDVFVRMATGRVLGDLRNPAAIPGLIEALDDEQAAVREATVVALRLLSGKDFRFDPLGTDSARSKAQGAWRKWWADNSEDLLGA